MGQQIYFLLLGGRIKIGTAKRVQGRVRAIETHTPDPVTLLGVIDGGYPLERAIHEHLRAYRVHREWFRNCREVREAIADILKRGASAIGFCGDVFKRASAVSIPPFEPDEGRYLTLAELVGFILRVVPQFSLAGLTDASEEQAAAWLQDDDSVPKLVRFAVAWAMVQCIASRDRARLEELLRHHDAIKDWPAGHDGNQQTPRLTACL